MKKEVKLTKKIHRFLKKLNQREYLHHFGPKKYKLKHHLVALLVMQSCNLSFRRAEKFLILIELEVPTYSALCKSRKRIPLKLWNKLLRETANLSSGSVAIDGTGFSRTNPSFHYLKRIDRKTPTKRYSKLSAMFDIRKKKFLTMKIRIKPRHDIKDVNYLMKRTDNINKFYADTGYDAEWLYKYCFWKGIQTFIKPRKNFKRGHFRKKQLKSFSEEEYHKRSLVESGFGSLKRKYGSFVRAKKAPGLRGEIICKGIAHNLGLR